MKNVNSMIVPSLLDANYIDMKSSVALSEKVGATCLHLDVMDGSFVPPISFGAKMVAAIRKITTLDLDVHLQIISPSAQLDFFSEAKIDCLNFHIETEYHTHRLISRIRSAGMKAGIAINPATPVTALTEVLDMVDQIIVMTVNPGYGGQELIPSTLKKVKTLADWRMQGYGDYLIAIDGGFSKSTADMVWDSGADIAMMGTAFFNALNPIKAFNECKKTT